MEQEDSQVFFEYLSTMSEFFSDEVSELRQRVYWQHFQQCTIEEWAYACDQAMQRETFHKVPLTAHLMDYVREYRRAQHELVLRAQCEDGVHTRKRLLELREASIDSSQVDALIASVWPDGTASLETPYPRRRVKLTAEELEYVPTVDGDTAKAKAREQLRQLLDAQADARNNAPEEPL